MRCVITGIGEVSSLGIGKEAILKSFQLGQTGLTDGNPRETEECRRAYWLKPLKAEEYYKSKSDRRMDEFGRTALNAAKNALDDSRLDLKICSADRIGCIYNTVFGPAETTLHYLDVLYKEGPTQVSPAQFANTVTNAAIGYISMEYQLKGVSSVVAGTSSVGYGFDLIHNKKADIIVCGGVELLPNDLLLSLNLENPVPNDKNCELSLPYSKNRTFPLLGEGSAFIILESLESALQRKADIYAEILGYRLYTDFENGLSFTDKTFAKEPILDLLKSFNLQPSEIQLLIGSGNGSRHLDEKEMQLFESLFCGGVDQVGLFSMKAYVGEAFGASETFSVIGGALAIKNQFIPALSGFESEKTSFKSSKNEIQQHPIEHAVIQSFEIGGTISSFILKRYQ